MKVSLLVTLTTAWAVHLDQVELRIEDLAHDSSIEVKLVCVGHSPHCHQLSFAANGFFTDPINFLANLTSGNDDIQFAPTSPYIEVCRRSTAKNFSLIEGTESIASGVPADRNYQGMWEVSVEPRFGDVLEDEHAGSCVICEPTPQYVMTPCVSSRVLTSLSLATPSNDVRVCEVAIKCKPLRFQIAGHINGTLLQAPGTSHRGEVRIEASNKQRLMASQNVKLAENVKGDLSRMFFVLGSVPLCQQVDLTATFWEAGSEAPSNDVACKVYPNSLLRAQENGQNGGVSTIGVTCTDKRVSESDSEILIVSLAVVLAALMCAAVLGVIAWRCRFELLRRRLFAMLRGPSVKPDQLVSTNMALKPDGSRLQCEWVEGEGMCLTYRCVAFVSVVGMGLDSGSIRLLVETKRVDHKQIIHSCKITSTLMQAFNSCPDLASGICNLYGHPIDAVRICLYVSPNSRHSEPFRSRELVQRMAFTGSGFVAKANKPCTSFQHVRFLTDSTSASQIGPRRSGKTKKNKNTVTLDAGTDRECDGFRICCVGHLVKHHQLPQGGQHICHRYDPVTERVMYLSI